MKSEVREKIHIIYIYIYTYIYVYMCVYVYKKDNISEKIIKVFIPFHIQNPIASINFDYC